MKLNVKTLTVTGLAVLAISVLTLGEPRAEDPFAAGVDALAVKAGGGSSSLRAKLKLKKLAADMVVVKVLALDDSRFPHCVVTAKVLKAAKSQVKYLKLLGRGKVYRFEPVLKARHGRVNLKDQMTQNNLGACYYPKRTALAIKVSGVDMKKRVFMASEIYPK